MEAFPIYIVSVHWYVYFNFMRNKHLQCILYLDNLLFVSWYSKRITKKTPPRIRDLLTRLTGFLQNFGRKKPETTEEEVRENTYHLYREGKSVIIS